MARIFTSITDFLTHGYDTVIDVRAPAEFAEDHIPGAINLPVLSDEERARVGTIYKQQSPFLARKLGGALVARNAAAHIEGPLAGFDGGWQPLVYCWRGGQRSGSFATILSQIGWRVELVDGGYRSYRRLVAAMLHDQPLPHRLVLLDGNTGTAKTALLARVAALGGQVLDLEGLAHHRGSLFGPVATPQPAQKGFESAIVAALSRMDPARPVLVEAESSKVGNLIVPPSVWAAMCAARRIWIEAPLEARASYLTRAYGDVVADRTRLAETLAKLKPVHGEAVISAWQALADANDFKGLSRVLMAEHYDPRYAHAREKHGADRLAQLDTADLGDAALDDLAARLLPLVEAA